MATSNILSNTMVTKENIDCATKSFKAMSHPMRLKILCQLNGRELAVGALSTRLGSSQSNISQHLSILRDKGILRSRKVSNLVYYSVEDMRTLKLIKFMQEFYN